MFNFKMFVCKFYFELISRFVVCKATNKHTFSNIHLFKKILVHILLHLKCFWMTKGRERIEYFFHNCSFCKYFDLTFIM
jgi:hypothetical protein